MKDRSFFLLLLLVGSLAAGSTAVLVDEARSEGQPGTESVEFQRLVGGLGFGPSTQLSPCTFGFDPRLAPACEADDGPIPGGQSFCHCHAGSVFCYPPLEARERTGPAEGRDGQVP